MSKDPWVSISFPSHGVHVESRILSHLPEKEVKKEFAKGFFEGIVLRKTRSEPIVGPTL
jgi:hypothetical protein